MDEYRLNIPRSELSGQIVLAPCFPELVVQGLVSADQTHAIREAVSKEIDKKPLLKYLLTQCVDNALYPGDTFYFREEKDMMNLLTSLNLDVTFHSIHEGKPLSQVIYIAKKKR